MMISHNLLINCQKNIMRKRGRGLANSWFGTREIYNKWSKCYISTLLTDLGILSSLPPMIKLKASTIKVMRGWLLSSKWNKWLIEESNKACKTKKGIWFSSNIISLRKRDVFQFISWCWKCLSPRGYLMSNSIIKQQSTKSIIIPNLVSLSLYSLYYNLSNVNSPINKTIIN